MAEFEKEKFILSFRKGGEEGRFTLEITFKQHYGKTVEEVVELRDALCAFAEEAISHEYEKDGKDEYSIAGGRTIKYHTIVSCTVVTPLSSETVARRLIEAGFHEGLMARLTD